MNAVNTRCKGFMVVCVDKVQKLSTFHYEVGDIQGLLMEST